MNEPDPDRRLEDFEDFFENALCGHLIIDPDGGILRSNSRMADWLGYRTTELKGKRLSSLLAVAGRIFYETHLAPLLRMQGYFDEVSLELVNRSGGRIQVLVNAYERRGEDGKPLCVRLAAYKATDRHTYEQNLRAAKTLAENQLIAARETSLLREQFIAVLGHDLRNPLGALMMGTAILGNAALEPRELELIEVMKESVNRMNALIADVMDFARGRLGGNMALKRQDVNLQPVLMHVIDELRIAHPSRKIEAEGELSELVDCDPGRVSQILSNLLYNALSHGSQDHPISVRLSIEGVNLRISVSNHGDPIPEDSLQSIFQPFSRKEQRGSGDGLGLGLYIAAEVAKAHHGTIAVRSNRDETRFTFQMPVSAQES